MKIPFRQVNFAESLRKHPGMVHKRVSAVVRVPYFSATQGRGANIKNNRGYFVVDEFPAMDQGYVNKICALRKKEFFHSAGKKSRFALCIVIAGVERVEIGDFTAHHVANGEIERQSSVGIGDLKIK